MRAARAGDRGALFHAMVKLIMSIDHERRDQREGLEAFEPHLEWRRGAVAGLAASVVMAIAITAMDLGTLRGAIAGLYGFRGSLLAGFLAHVVHGTLFGVLFAGVLSDPGLYRVERWLWKSVLAGAVFGVVLAVVAAGIIMPIWLGLVGFPTPPAFPNVSAATLAWHLVYGTVLGGVYALADHDALTR